MAMYNTPGQQSAGMPQGPAAGGQPSGPGQVMPMAGQALPGAVANNAPVPGAPPTAQSNAPPAPASTGNQPAMGIWANPTQSSFQMRGGDDMRDRAGGNRMDGGWIQQMIQNNPQLAQRFASILSQPMQGGQMGEVPRGQMPGQPLPHLPVQPPGAGVGGAQQPQLPGMPMQPSPMNPAQSAQQTPTGIMPTGVKNG